MLLFLGQLPWDVKDHPVVLKLQKNLLFSILSMMISFASVEDSCNSIEDSNDKENEIENEDRMTVKSKSAFIGERNISVIRTLATLLKDEILVNETHLKIGETITRHPSISAEGQDVLNIQSIQDEIRYPMLRKVSVTELITSIATTNTVCVLSSQVGTGFICIPIECSLCRPAPVPLPLPLPLPSSANRRENAKASYRNPTTISNMNLKNGRDSMNNSKYSGGIHEMDLDPVFAKGLSLIYTDTNAPEGHVTVLTVAYHINDFSSMAKHCPILSPDHTNRSSNNSGKSTSTSTFPLQVAFPSLQIRIPDSTCRTFPIPLIASGSCKEHSRDTHDGNMSRESIAAEHPIAPNVRDTCSVSRSISPVHKDEIATFLSVSHSTTSDLNKAEGGLFGFIVDEMSTFLTCLFADARREVHKQQAWDIVYKNIIPKNYLPGSIKNSIFQIDPNIATDGKNRDWVADCYDRTAWVENLALKHLLLFFIEQSPSIPLPFLSFLHKPLLLFAQSSSIFDRTSINKLKSSSKYGNVSDGRFLKQNNGKEDALIQFINNFTIVFHNRCYWFITNENNDDDSSTYEDEKIRLSSSEKVDYDRNYAIEKGNLSRDKITRAKGNSLHILISQPPVPDNSGYHGCYLAVHICIPLTLLSEDLGVPNSKFEKNTRQENDTKSTTLLKSKSNKIVEKKETNDISFFHLIKTGDDVTAGKCNERSQNDIDHDEKCEEKFIGQIVDMIVFSVSRCL